MRLAVIGVVSLLPIYCIEGRPGGIMPINIMFTLLLGLICIWGALEQKAAPLFLCDSGPGSVRWVCGVLLARLPASAIGVLVVPHTICLSRHRSVSWGSEFGLDKRESLGSTRDPDLLRTGFPSGANPSNKMVLLRLLPASLGTDRRLTTRHPSTIDRSARRLTSSFGLLRMLSR